MRHANVTIRMSSTPGQSFLEVIYVDIEMCIVDMKKKSVDVLENTNG